MPNASPVFIHSLFRSGSTYLFNCFRRSPGGYYCYQEPLNEFLLAAAERPEKLLEVHEGTAKLLRHPDLGRPYFQEFHPLAEQVARYFRSRFPYADYFANSADAADPLCDYLTALAQGAQGRPVFQECRSCGRVESIRRCLGGLHVFLWRNPWDQWWSYKVDSYFDTCNLQLLASVSAPSLFVELRGILDFDPHGADIADLVAQRLDAAGSYMLFFALWCHAMLEAGPRCDLDINIDSLSRNAGYRAEVLGRLEADSVTGLDLSDCVTPIGTYGRDDRAFFGELESRVLELLPRHGYSGSDVARMLRLRGDHDFHGAGGAGTDAAASRDFDRIRQTARRLESELSTAQREVGRLVGARQAAEERSQALDAALSAKEAERRFVEDQLWAKEAERRSIEEKLWAKEAERRSVEEKLWAKEAERQSVEEKLWAKEAERQGLETALHAAVESHDEERRQLEGVLQESQMELSQIKASRYWRWGRPVRAAGGLALKFLHRDKG